MNPKIYSSEEHGIDHSFVDADALQAIAHLNGAGHRAYLVGGGVRDLIAGRYPKDFDISTSAEPEEVRRLFGRRCILIGRRFLLAHLRYSHRKVLEVSTFRSGENDGELIVRDNCWGSPEEDALRRDFTMNGLFYDPLKREVIDYVNGMHDLQNGVLRTIGDPTVRFRQDPVRMLRLLKFRARFGYRVAPETEQAIRLCQDEITKSSPARILEEILRMLESGAAAPFIELMVSFRLLERIFPRLDNDLRGACGERIYRLLAAADLHHVTSGRQHLDRAVLASCLLYPQLEELVEKYSQEHGSHPHLGDISMLASQLIHDVLVAASSRFPRRLSVIANFILTNQFRLTPSSGKRQRRQQLLARHEFHLSLQFLSLRAASDNRLADDYQWWQQMVHQALHQGGHHQGDHHRNAPSRESHREEK